MMRQVPGHSLWIGHAGDARDFTALRAAGIAAIVDLAAAEPPLGAGSISRDAAYCRFPLVDGAGNELWLLRAALEAAAGLIRSGVPTLIFCGAGMSRSPAIAAAAIALATGRPASLCLAEISSAGSCDVSCGLWDSVLAAMKGSM